MDRWEVTKPLTKNEELIERIGYAVDRQTKIYQATFLKHRSPLSYLMSSKIKPLYHYLDSGGQSSIHHYILDEVNERLLNEGARARLTLNKKTESYVLHVTKADRHLYTWDPLEDTLVIPDFDEANDLMKAMDKLWKEIQALEEELFVTEVLVNKPTSLMENKMWNLYLYSLFRPKRFKEDMAHLLGEIKEDKANLERELMTYQSQVDGLTKDRDLLRILRRSHVYFLYFPKIESLDHYNQLNQDELRRD